jgi:hypothetical protein
MGIRWNSAASPEPVIVLRRRQISTPLRAFFERALACG